MRQRGPGPRGATRAGPTAVINTQSLPLLLTLLAAAPLHSLVEGQTDVNAMLAALSGSPAPSPPPARVKTAARAPAVSGVASFGLGCFWGGQIAFSCADDLVYTTLVGYMGGLAASSAYAPVYADYAEHGYTETVELVYDAEQSEYAYMRLLEIFWASHNPTSPVDGSAYSSVIFAHTEQQARLARQSIAARNEELAGECGSVHHPDLVSSLQGLNYRLFRSIRLLPSPLRRASSRPVLRRRLRCFYDSPDRKWGFFLAC